MAIFWRTILWLPVFVIGIILVITFVFMPVGLLLLYFAAKQVSEPIMEYNLDVAQEHEKEDLQFWRKSDDEDLEDEENVPWEL